MSMKPIPINGLIPYMGDLSDRTPAHIILNNTFSINHDVRGEFSYDSIFGFLDKKPKYILFSFDPIHVAMSIVRMRIDYDDNYREAFKAAPAIPRTSYMFTFGHNIPSTYEESYSLTAIGFESHEEMFLFKLSNSCNMRPISHEEFDVFVSAIELHHRAYT